jgi:hypothetical protein
MINQSQHPALTLPCPSRQGRGKDWGRKEDENEWSFIQGHRYNQKEGASKEKRRRKKTEYRRRETGEKEAGRQNPEHRSMKVHGARHTVHGEYR